MVKLCKECTEILNQRKRFLEGLYTMYEFEISEEDKDYAKKQFDVIRKRNKHIISNHVRDMWIQLIDGLLRDPETKNTGVMTIPMKSLMELEERENIYQKRLAMRKKKFDEERTKKARRNDRQSSKRPRHKKAVD